MAWTTSLPLSVFPPFSACPLALEIDSQTSLSCLAFFASVQLKGSLQQIEGGEKGKVVIAQLPQGRSRLLSR